MVLYMERIASVNELFEVTRNILTSLDFQKFHIILIGNVIFIGYNRI